MTIEDRIYRLIKLLLYTAKQENAKVTPTKFQKIFFLLEKEKGVQLGLDFEPWLFGAYSSKLQDYLYRLVELGEVDVIEEEEVRDPLSGAIIGYKKNYVLSSGFEPEEEEREIEAFFREWVKKSKDEIMNYAYRKYPEYFSYERIRENVLTDF
ncbi:MAG: conjugal transfer protein [Sulfolobaceae archaeon]